MYRVRRKVGEGMTKRELAAKIICNSIAFLMLVSMPFMKTTAGIVLNFVGGISWNLLGMLSWIWLGMLPRRKKASEPKQYDFDGVRISSEAGFMKNEIHAVLKDGTVLTASRNDGSIEEVER